MIENLHHFGIENRDMAYLLGFCLIALLFYWLEPYRTALNIATSENVAFKDIDVKKQIAKPFRLFLASGSIALFCALHFAIGASFLALLIGFVPLAVLLLADHRQLRADYTANR